VPALDFWIGRGVVRRGLAAPIVTEEGGGMRGVGGRGERPPDKKRRTETAWIDLCLVTRLVRLVRLVLLKPLKLVWRTAEESARRVGTVHVLCRRLFMRKRWKALYGRFALDSCLVALLPCCLVAFLLGDTDDDGVVVVAVVVL
jgi:hypothetical protein